MKPQFRDPGAEHDGALTADDETESPETTARRRMANECTEQHLDDEIDVSHRMAWGVLSLWTCKRSIRRKAARPEE